MKKHLILILTFGMLSFLVSSILACKPEKSVVFQSQNANFSDTIAARVSFGAIKINPLQLLFNEFPVSFEMDISREWSIQFQIGYIFPSSKNNGFRHLFESNGPNADASSEGLFSYRNSPFNNHGLSFKIEFRKNGRSAYYGPQIMYKRSFYKEDTFPIYNGSITRDITESKYSNIFGIGYFLGRQWDNRELVFDFYTCIGLRLRQMSVTTVKIVDSPRPVSYPNTTENFSSFYPFINLGLRIGVKLWKNVRV
jgi:hypothetical protein